MKNLISSVTIAVILSGCASTTVYVTPSPVEGSKADGTLVMGYIVEREPMTSVNAIVNWDSAKKEATKKCKRWGYNSAEKFGNFTTTSCQEQKVDIMWTGDKYCSKELVKMTYQCEK